MSSFIERISPVAKQSSFARSSSTSSHVVCWQAGNSASSLGARLSNHACSVKESQQSAGHCSPTATALAHAEKPHSLPMRRLQLAPSLQQIFGSLAKTFPWAAGRLAQRRYCLSDARLVPKQCDSPLLFWVWTVPLGQRSGPATRVGSRFMKGYRSIRDLTIAIASGY